MTQDDEPDEPLSDAELHDLGVRLILGVLKSADTDMIAPKDWWRRAQAALEAGAGMSASYPQMVSKIAEKLEIPAANKWTAREISSRYSADSVGARVHAYDQFDRFRTLCERDAFMIISDAQVVREMEREEFEGDYEKQADDLADPFGLASEMDLSTTKEE